MSKLPGTRLKNAHKPNLLILTSSFPNEPDDETCGYIRDHARALSSEFNVRVLAPADRGAREWPADLFTLSRSRSWVPKTVDPFQATSDFNELPMTNQAVKFLATISLSAFFREAVRLSLDADVICSHWLAPSGVIGAIISRVLGKPHIVVEHSGAAHLLARMRFGRALARFTARRSFRIVTVSEDLKNKFLSLCPDAAGKMEVIPMGIGDSRRRETEVPVDQESPNQHAASQAIGTGDSCAARRVLFVGRLSEIKGIDVLIKALSELNDVQLLLAGTGKRKRELEELANRLSVNAMFLGRADAKSREHLLSVCDAVVVPSIALPNGRTEGMPVVCLEAMAAEKVVVASRVGGLAELIVDGHNGMLFNPGDHHALAETLKLIFADARLRLKLSTNARVTAAAYRWPLIGSRFNQIIRDSLKENGPVIHDRDLAPESARC